VGAPSSDQSNEALNPSLGNDISFNSKFSEQSSPVDSRVLGPNSSIYSDQNQDPSDSTMPQTPAPSDSPVEAPFDVDLFPPIYDLIGVSHHCGTLNGGHYVAHVDTNPATKPSDHHNHQAVDFSADINFRADMNSVGDCQDRERCVRDTSAGHSSEDSRWMCFNDEQVSPASPVDIIGPTAYVLFYRLREYWNWLKGLIFYLIIVIVSLFIEVWHIVIELQ
jgi:Ubiquitin carboxyl-terminal hydrolase